MNPLAIATDGFLSSPLSISASGYLNFLIESIIKSSSGGGSKYKNKHYDRLLREDDELLEIIISLILGDIIA